MSIQYGIEAASRPHHGHSQEPARYLLLIDSADGRLARLYLADRREVAEFDAGAEEVSSMIDSLLPERGAEGAEWDRALAAHTAEQRRQAEVYTLSV